MTIDMTQFLQTFYEESFEGLDIMESELLNLDVGAADDEIINTIFRSAHSIKGGSGTFGLSAVADYTHVMETLLDEMRDGRRQVTQEGVEILLRSVDVLRGMLTALQADDELDNESIADSQKELDNLLQNNTTVADGVNTEDVSSTKVVNEQSNSWKIHFSPHANMLKTGNDPVRILRELAALGEMQVNVITDKLPGFHDIEPEDSYLGWNITLQGDIKKEAITEVFEWVEDECDLDITPVKENVAENNQMQGETEQNADKESQDPKLERRTNTERRAGDRRKSSTESASIRVSIDKVDELINTVGELVITQSMLGQLGGSEEFNSAHIEKLRDGLAQLERNTRELQESVMRIRMLPISFTFQRFPRLVHDLSGKLGKKIELKMSGEGTELDKTVMEKIGDPLVHLVRNSIDHGIEMPDIRVENGKSEMGLVHLNAYHQGGNIVIEITDDGAGLNKEKILEKAIKSGIASEGDSLTDDQVYDLIFQPGFSTAEEVTDVSGRGVGMDVVRKNIRSLGGTVDVKSQPGVGSTFSIRLPLTLAILDGQLITVGSETYIVPLVSIVESIQVKQEQVNLINGRGEVYKLRDEYIPVVRLYHMFGIKPQSEKLDDGLLVVVEAEGQKIALYVDDLQGQQQVVIKSLETNFKKVEGVSGATILGDGTVALILDITGLVSLNRTSGVPDLSVVNDGDVAA